MLLYIQSKTNGSQIRIKEILIMFCNHCGNKIEEDAKICNRCGSRINRCETKVTGSETALNGVCTTTVRVMNAQGTVAVKKGRASAVFKWSIPLAAIGTMLVISGVKQKNGAFAVGAALLAVAAVIFIVAGLILLGRLSKRLEEKSSQRSADLCRKLEHRAESRLQMVLCAAALVGGAYTMFIKTYTINSIKVSVFDLLKIGIGLGTKKIAGIPLGSQETKWMAIIAAVIAASAFITAASVLMNSFTLHKGDDDYSVKIHRFWNSVKWASGCFAAVMFFYPSVIYKCFSNDHKIISKFIGINFADSGSIMTYILCLFAIVFVFACVKDRKYKKVFGEVC